MGERSVFWDIATLFLLACLCVLMLFVVIQNERGWGVIQDVKKEQVRLESQNQQLIKMLKEDGISVHGSVNTAPAPETPAAPGPIQPAVAKQTRPAGMEHIPLDVPLPVVPNLPRGDENADDGDKFIFSDSSEPHSLNYLVEHDSTSSSAFNRVHDSLCKRLFDDPTVWIPQLALAWKREMVCLAYCRDGKAADLARDIDAALDQAKRAEYHIKKVTTENVGGEDVVRLELSDLDNGYAEFLKKNFSTRIEPQWWFYIDFKGQYFMDGKDITPNAVSQKVLASLKAIPGIKARFLPTWNRQDSIIVKVLGDQAAREAVDTALKAMVAAPDNKSQVIDQSVTGRHEDKFLSYSAWEDYVAQEKPVFTFYLRKDVKWHDGVAFTGKDAVFTFNTLMNPLCECGPSRTYIQDCESVKLVDGDPYVIQFTWGKPYFNAWGISAGFTPIAEHYYAFTDPKEFNTGKQNQSLVGNGPYRFEKWVHDQSMSFVRNEQYYGVKPHVKGIVVKIIKDPTVQLQSLEKNDLDLLGLTPSQYVVKERDEQFRKRFDFNISVANSYSYVGWNMRLSKFKDRRVRQALTMLIDKNRICKDIFRDKAIPLHGPIHPENPAYLKDVELHPWPFDLKRAKQTLAEAGWKEGNGNGVLEKDGEQFKFTLLIRSNSPEQEAVANLIKDSFAQAGIEVTVNNFEWKTFLEKIHHLQFDACILGWGGMGLDEDPYQLWHSTQIHEKESNHCGYVNPEVDRLIERARRELNESKRFELLRQFQKIIFEDQPYTFLAVPKRLVAYDKRIHNIQYKFTGAEVNRWWVPAGEQMRNE